MLAVEPTPQPLQAFEGHAKTTKKNVKADIIDIRQAALEVNLEKEIFRLFRPQEGPRKLPTMLLYDEEGLRLFEKITYLDEYYLTNNEIQVLRQSAVDIAKHIPSHSVVIELGSGNLRKVMLLLQALNDARKEVDYYALDLSESELVRTLSQVPKLEFVRCHGLLGTYDDGREWLKHPAIASRNKCIMSLGSSIGNFDRNEAVDFLGSFSQVLQPADTLLIGVDSCANPEKLYHAYNDREGLTHEFILNGLHNANKILGAEEFHVSDWDVVGEYVYDDRGGRHQAFYAPRKDVTVLGEVVRAKELVQVEQSLKFSAEDMAELWKRVGLVETGRWMTQGDEYGLHMLVKPPVVGFSLVPNEYASSSLPKWTDWESLWGTWDIVTRRMLPDEELQEKPIKLRNACIFYLGHIPTFLDIQLTKTTKKRATEPAYFSTIFERGIDPDVDNPAQCHAHSEVPSEWPVLGDILNYQGRVRARLRDIYSKGSGNIPRDVGRAVWIGFEHELMHLETLLYMTLQSDKTLPPSHAPKPDFRAMAEVALANRTENRWFTIPEQTIQVGMNDPEGNIESNGHFGWDNEKPARQVHVKSFQAKGRPITNEEYAKFLYSTNDKKLPASWTLESSTTAKESMNGNGHSLNGVNGNSSLPTSFLKGKAVRTVYGLVPLKDALDWPVFASYDELSHYAAFMGGRIPTFEEVESIYYFADRTKKHEVEHKLGKFVPAVNGHLVNDGVEETPPHSESNQVNGDLPSSSLSSEGVSNELFIDLTGANVGFRHWHPTPVTGHGNRLAGQGDLGGVWEWTSSTLEKHEGFEPMALYPAYTVDFFDDKHNVVLGGSWATHPRIAGRKSFVNFYQRNYPYAWIGARLVRDL